jgi:hypothetical protein
MFGILRGARGGGEAVPKQPKTDLDLYVFLYIGERGTQVPLQALAKTLKSRAV